MSDNKIKVYKNPERNRKEGHEKYTPEYQLRGLEPEKIKSISVPNNTLVSKSGVSDADNPRTRAIPAIRQPYAQNINSPIGRGKGPVPNVGNNLEHTWSGVDGEIIDDIFNEEIDPDHEMIDNNDFVSAESFGTTNLPTQIEQDVQSEQNEYIQENDLFSSFKEMPEETYILLISGIIIHAGSLDDVQDQARDLIFGEHELCDGNPIPVDDILVLKRVKVNVGVFLV